MLTARSQNELLNICAAKTRTLSELKVLNMIVAQNFFYTSQSLQFTDKQAPLSLI